MSALQLPHAESSAEVLAAGVRAIGSLACDIRTNVTKLRELGACAGTHAVDVASHYTRLLLEHPFALSVILKPTEFLKEKNSFSCSSTFLSVAIFDRFVSHNYHLDQCCALHVLQFGI